VCFRGTLGVFWDLGGVEVLFGGVWGFVGFVGVGMVRFGAFWVKSGGLKMGWFWGFWSGGRGVLRKWGFFGFSGV